MVNAHCSIPLMYSLVPWLLFLRGFIVRPLIGCVVRNWVRTFFKDFFLFWSCVLKPRICAKTRHFLVGSVSLLFDMLKSCEGGIHGTVCSRCRLHAIPLWKLFKLHLMFLQPIFVNGLIFPDFGDVVIRIVSPSPWGLICYKLGVFVEEMFFTDKLLLFFHKFDHWVLFL